MSRRTDEFKAALAIVAERRAQALERAHGDAVATTAIKALADGVLVSVETPEAATIAATDGVLKGYTQTFIDMLPPWARIAAPPSWYTRRVKREDGSYAAVVDVKGWAREQIAALNYAASGDAPIVQVDGKARFDISMPCTLARMFDLIKLGNVQQVLGAAAGLIKNAKRHGKAGESDVDGARVFQDGFLDLGSGVLMDAAAVKIAYAASDLAAATAREEKARVAYRDAYTGDMGRLSDAYARATSKRQDAARAFTRAWESYHPAPVAPADEDAAPVIKAPAKPAKPAHTAPVVLSADAIAAVKAEQKALRAAERAAPVAPVAAEGVTA